MIGRAALAVCTAAALATGARSEPCRLALALGLDVSGSVDAMEYRLQVQGVAAALTAPSVVAAFLEVPSAPVWLAVYDWSGPASQRVLVDWMPIRAEGDLHAVAVRLAASPRADGDPATALGQAKAIGGALLRQRADCWRLVLDLSGDGKSNSGPVPGAASLPGITVNALVIGTPAQADRDTAGVGELVAYFRAEVIEGPGAFVETALGFQDIRTAMERKLLRELQTAVFGGR